MPSRRPPSPAGSGGKEQSLQRKLADLVARRSYSQAIRLREQALRRQPELELQPGEAQLWCLEGRQALEERQPKRAETALATAMALGLHGEPLYLLARLRLDQGQPEKALALLQEGFEAGTLPKVYAGAYLKMLLLTGRQERVRELIRAQPRRFQAQQIHWASGVLNLLEGNPGNARRQFVQMVGPGSPGDHGAVWRAWACLEAGNSAAAAAALKDADHPACAAVALDLAARTGQHPGDLLDLKRRDLPRRELAHSLELLHHLRQRNLLSAAQLLLANERPLLAAVPELATLRRPLLLLAGQQALERDAPGEAIRCWRPIVDRPAFDPDLALRLYPLLDQGDSDDSQEAERLASQLLGWVRRAARDSPSAWPEPVLSTTLARLHCWQADQLMRLGMRQQARRSVEQARQLAPDLPDVTGRRGMLAFVAGEATTAIPLLWQALQGGCRSSHVYELLDEALDVCGQETERRRLEREHGPRFGVTPRPGPEQGGMAPAWLDALSRPDVLEMADVLRIMPANSAALEALKIFVDHVSPPRGAADGRPATTDPSKVTLEMLGASSRWDALIAPLPPTDQVEALTAILAAIHRFCRRTGRVMLSQIAARMVDLEHLAADPGTPQGDHALRALLLLAGLRLKRSEAPGEVAKHLLRRTHQPERLLSLALLDLRMLASTRPWQAVAEELRRQDPHNPLLTLALATMQRSFSYPYNRLTEEAFDLARRQQDSEALAACRREQWWAEACFDREAARRQVRSLRSLAQEQGMGPQVDAQQEADGPDPDRIDPEDEEVAPPPRRPGRRRTFMDL
jgi:tetratricopeptide (TPR) repeat protein